MKNNHYKGNKNLNLGSYPWCMIGCTQKIVSAVSHVCKSDNPWLSVFRFRNLKTVFKNYLKLNHLISFNWNNFACTDTRLKRQLGPASLNSEEEPSLHWSNSELSGLMQLFLGGKTLNIHFLSWWHALHIHTLNSHWRRDIFLH